MALSDVWCHQHPSPTTCYAALKYTVYGCAPRSGQAQFATHSPVFKTRHRVVRYPSSLSAKLFLHTAKFSFSIDDQISVQFLCQCHIAICGGKSNICWLFLVSILQKKLFQRFRLVVPISESLSTITLGISRYHWSHPYQSIPGSINPYLVEHHKLHLKCDLFDKQMHNEAVRFQNIKFFEFLILCPTNFTAWLAPFRLETEHSDKKWQK